MSLLGTFILVFRAIHLFLPVSYRFKSYIFVTYFEIRGEKFDICSQDYFGYLGSLVVPHIFGLLFSISVKMTLTFCLVLQ